MKLTVSDEEELSPSREPEWPELAIGGRGSLESSVIEGVTSCEDPADAGGIMKVIPSPSNESAPVLKGSPSSCGADEGGKWEASPSPPAKCGLVGASSGEDSSFGDEILGRGRFPVAEVVLASQ